MALFQCHFFSEALKLSTTMTVILPQNPKETRKYPTLYLLHGNSDDHSIWLRRTSIERYVEGRGLAVVMPEVHRSYYTDMKQGSKYWTFVSEELPALARSFFPLSDRREDNFVAGLSMGGYGAFKLAFRHPDRYAAAASLSGALDLRDMRGWRHPVEEYHWIFGGPEAFAGSENDLFHLSERMIRSASVQPRLYQCCGTEDFLYEDNRRFLEHARALGLDLTYEEEPGGHTWDYWGMKIQRVLDWLAQS
jgi:S-formylglutathione hydrolase FrmB